ncbi:DUF7507 domain-containing protein [Tenacibaculum sp. ZS6-P6]|uniref:DUF7507 domain-containing protein n=1 Tax=Tenacibaculum sp. ZS6-P6 TaxID=3447503 RepID=UPI003F9CD373
MSKAAAQSSVGRIWTDWNGYWTSNVATTGNNRPDSYNNLTAFRWNGTVYSTGVNDASLTANGVSFTPANFKSLPIRSIPTGGLFLQGARIDGTVTVANLIPPVAGATATSEEYAQRLTDGVKGLALGTGVANIPAGQTTFQLQPGAINISTINDGVPDLLFNQIAQPSSTVDRIWFVDSSGNVVGNQVSISFLGYPVLGTYILDIFNPDGTLWAGASNTSRDIRMMALDYASLGITTANASQVDRLIVRFSGQSDIGFVAANEASLQVPDPALTVVKTATFNDANGNSFADVGETITYVFTITNIGNIAIDNIVISDPMPGLTISGNPIASLAPGATNNTITATYAVTQADLDNGSVSNNAIAQGLAVDLDGDGNPDTVTFPSDDDGGATDANGDGNPYNDSTIIGMPVNPGIGITKVGVLNDGGDGLQAGDSIDYTFVVSNTGNVTLSSVVLNDPLLGGVVSGPVSGDTNSNNLLEVDETWTYTASYTLLQSDVDSGSVVNTATVSGSSPSGTGVSDDSDDPNNPTNTDANSDGEPDDPTVVGLPESPSIGITKVGVLNDGGDGLQAGDSIDYTFVVSNTGNVTLSSVVLNDPLLGGVVSGPVSGDTNSNNLLEVDETWTYTASYTLLQSDVDSGSVVNTATVSGSSPSGTGVSDDSDDPNNPTNTDANSDGEPDDPTVVGLPESPSIGITKVGVLNDGGDGLQAGDSIDYTFVVSNTGNVTLSSVVLNDPLLGGVVSGPVSGDTNSNNLLEVDETWTYTASYTLLQSDVDSGSVVNTATVSGSSPSGTGVSDDSDDPNNPTNTDANSDGEPDDPTVVGLPESPSIGITKVGVLNDGGDGLQAGDSIDYTFVVSNTGNVTLSSVVLNDPLLGGVVSGPVSGDTNSNNLLEVDETWTYTASYTLLQSDVDSGSVVNTATVSGSSPSGTGVSDDSDDPNNPTNTDANSDGEPDDPTVVSLPESPSIGITKVGVLNDGGDGLQAGDSIDYTFVVSNTGNVTLSSVVLNDPLLGGVVSGPVSGDTNSNNLLEVDETWTYTASYTLLQSDVDSGSVVNTATVSGSSPSGTGVSDDSDDPNNPTNTDANSDGEPDDPTVVGLPESPSIGITKVGVLNDGGDGLQAGDSIDYTFVVSNTGNVTLSSVVLNDPLLGGVVSGPVSGDTNSNNLLEVDETWTYTASYTLLQSDVDSGSVVNTATVSGSSPSGTGVSDDSDDPNNPTNTDANSDGEPDDPTVVGLPESPSIGITKVGVLNDGGDGLQAGDSIDYTFVVSNTGNVTLSSVVLNDPLLGGVVSGPVSGDTNSNNLLEVDETWTYTASYTLLQSDVDSGSVVNTATVSGNSPSGTGVSDDSDDPNNPTNTDANSDGEPDDPTVVGLPESPSIGITKVGVLNDGGDGLQAGDSIDYTFVVSNTGNVTLSSVVLNDPLLGGVVSGPVSGDTNSNNLLEVDETWTYTASYTLLQSDVDSGSVVNTATVSGSSPSGTGVSDDSDDPNNPTNTDANSDGEPDDPTVVGLPESPSIGITKVGVLNDGGDGLQAGDSIDYTFVVSNTGNVTLSSVVLNDPLLGGVVSGPVSGDTNSNNLLEVDETWTYTASYTLLQSDVDSGSVVNTATVSGSSPSGTGVSDDSDDPNNPTNTDANSDGEPDDPTVVGLPESPSIGITKVGVLNDGGDGLQAGDSIDYTFVVSNTGNVTLSSVVLNDPLLGGVVSGPVSGDTNSNNLLEVDETWTYTASYTLLQSDVDSGSVVNTATVSGSSPSGTGVSDDSDDPNNPTNTDANSDGEPDDPTVVGLPESPSIGITKVGVLNDGGDGLQAGDSIDYTFVVSNTGNVTLSSVVLNDPLLGGVVSGPVSGDTNSNNLLEVDETWTYTASYTLLQSDVDSGSVVNTATVSGNSPSGTGVSDDSDDPNNPTNTDANSDGEPDDPTVVGLPESPSIGITKVGVLNDGGDGLQAGDSIDYTFVVSNTGNVTLSSVVLNDPLLGGVVSGPVSGDTNSNNLLEVDETWTYTASYTLLQSDVDSGSVVNTATVSGSSPSGTGVSDDSDDPNNPTNTDANSDGEPDDPTVVGLPESPSIGITKVGVLNDGGDGLQAGDSIDYTFVVSNTGNVTLSSVVLNDPLLGGVVSGPVSGDTNSNNLLEVDETWTYTASYTLLQSDVDSGSVVNTATVSGSSPSGTGVSDDSDDPNNPTNTDANSDGEPDDPTVVGLPESPSIGITKVGVLNDGGDGLQAGDSIDYTFVVSNTGNVTLSSVVLNDPLLGGVVSGPVSGDTNSNNLLEVDETWTYTASYTLLQSDVDSGSVVNTATVSGSSPSGTGVSDDSDDPNNPTNTDANSDGEPDDPTVVGLPESPSIGITKVGVLNDGGDGLQAGDSIDYTFVVSNTGNVTLSSVVLNDPLLGGVVSGPVSGDTNSNNLLEVDETWTYTASYTLLQSDVDSGSVVNTATVSGSSPSGTGVSDDSDDPNNPTNTDANSDGEPDDPTVVGLPESPSIGITKVGVLNDGGDGLQAGDSIDYTFVVSNTGNVTLSSVVLNDPLLGGVVSGPVSGDTNSNNLLEVDETWTYTASYTLLQSDVDSGSVVNTATVSGSSPSGTGVSDDSDDPNNPTNTDANSDGEPDDPTVVGLPESPSIGITKVGVLNDGGDGLQAGDSIDYTFVVSNTGNVTLSSVVLNDPLLGGVVSGPVSGDTNSNNLLEVDETWTYTASYTLLQSDVDSGSVVNTATVSGNSPSGTGVSDDSDDPNNPTNTDANSDGEPDDPTVVGLPESPSIGITKVGVLNDGGDGLQAGDSIDYTFVVSNTGNVTLSSVVLNDPLLGGVVSGPVSGDTNSNNLLEVDETWTYTASYTLLQSDVDSGSVVNTATVSGSSPSGTGVSDDSDDPNNPTNTDANSDGEPDDPTVVGLPESPSIGITKVGVLNDGGDGLQAGDSIDYTFVVSNTGNVTLSSVVLNDPLLGGVVSGPVSGDTNSNNLLEVDETWTYTASYTLLQSDVDSGSVVNTATVSGSSPSGTGVSDDSDDPNNPTNTDANSDGEPDDPTVVGLNLVSSVAIIKTAEFNDENNNGITEEGETISYYFTVVNTGNTTLFDVSVDDQLPNIILTGNVIEVLLPGESDSTSYSAIYTITQEDLNNGFVSNQAICIGFNSNDEEVSDLSDFESLTNDNPTIVPLENDDVIIYNIFTPNNDGDNDLFVIGGIESFPNNRLEIFNRWGNLVYKKSGYDNTWNGTSNGRVTIQVNEKLPTGTYYYVLDLGNGSKPKVGWLYINR